MRGETWNRIKETFLTAMDLSGDERSTYLTETCGDDEAMREEIEFLLEVHGTTHGFLDSGSGRLRNLLAVVLNGSDIVAGDQVGSYRVQRVIATGGMGVVYEAEQENPRRQVALKVMRGAASTSSLRTRFEREARLLGKLEHPGIARIYEADIIETPSEVDPESAIPFFAMELVRGEAVIKYAEDHRLATSARLELIARVCDAVHYAHDRGIVHRDLKPDNILVDASGQPKILDFGIARAVGVDRDPATVCTMAGQLLGTLPYMSPEQVSEDASSVDERTDVYSLGVLLHEILTGSLPHDFEGKSLPETARIIKEVSPRRIGAIDSAFRGDLETIVSKSLAADRARRYQSAAELAVDLRRYVHRQPILARPPSVLYSVGKFAQRHRAATVSAAILLISLTAASIVSTKYAVDAAAQRDAALSAKSALERAVEQSDSANQFLMNLLLDVPIHEVAIGQVITRASERLNGAESLHPDAEIMFRSVVGRGLRKLWRMEESEHHLQRQLQLLELRHGALDDRYARALQDLAQLYVDWGRLPKAREILIRAFDVRRELHGTDHVTPGVPSRVGWQALQFLPGSPEAQRIWEALRRERGLPPTDRPLVNWGVRSDAPVLFEADFSEGVLEASWVKEQSDSCGWKINGQGKALEVEAPNTLRNSRELTLEGESRLTFRRSLEPLGDFRIEMDVSWTGHESSGKAMDGRRAMQAVGLALVTAEKHLVTIGYGDAWFETTGRISAHVEDKMVATIPGSLKSEGSARFEIHRVHERCTVFWDGKPFATVVNDAPITQLLLQFHFARHRQEDECSTFGKITIHRLVIAGCAAK